jgi:hypothetical protein
MGRQVTVWYRKSRQGNLHEITGNKKRGTRRRRRRRRRKVGEQL